MGLDQELLVSLAMALAIVSGLILWVAGRRRTGTKLQILGVFLLVFLIISNPHASIWIRIVGGVCGVIWISFLVGRVFGKSWAGGPIADQ